MINMLIDVAMISTENQVRVLAYADGSTAGKVDKLRKWWDTLYYYCKFSKETLYRRKIKN